MRSNRHVEMGAVGRSLDLLLEAQPYLETSDHGVAHAASPHERNEDRIPKTSDMETGNG